MLDGLALVRRALVAGQHGVRSGADGGRPDQRGPHAGIAPDLLQQEGQLHVQVADGRVPRAGEDQQLRLAAPVGPLCQAIARAVIDEVGIAARVHGGGIAVVGIAQLALKRLLQVLRVQRALRVQVPHQPRRAAGVADGGQQGGPDFILVHVITSFVPVGQHSGG